MKVVVVFLALPLFLGMLSAQEQQPRSQSETRSVQTPSQDVYVAPRGPGIKPPHVTYSPDPKYPKGARKAHKQGTVVLRVIVGSDGLTRQVEVSGSLDPELDQAAADAVRKWKFDPATKDDKPVPVQINVEVNFKLN